MERKTFLEHYRACEDGGSPVERGRAGVLITCKAVDTRFDEPVTVKRISVSSVDLARRDEFGRQARAARVLDHVNIAKVLGFGIEAGHFVFVSEYLEGETLDSWVGAHGPMPPEAVLRVALQVVNALGAAGFHGLTHRAIQPSNLAIVPREIAEGGWPFIKILDFGVAELKLQSDSEMVPSMAPQFASPEQWQLGISDFRSEIYSLGATMCFLLTGAIESPESRLRKLGRFPRALRNLLANMLHDNPDDRPQDPVVFAEAIRECLVRVERRQELSRRFGIPLVPVVPKMAWRPPDWIPRRGLALATLVLALATIAAVLLPQSFRAVHRNRVHEPLGVPIGVPDTSSVAQNAANAAVPVVQPPLAANVANAAPVASASPVSDEPVTISPLAIANANENSPAEAQSPPAPNTEIVAESQTPEPPPPAKGPDDLLAETEAPTSEQPTVTKRANGEPTVEETASQSPKEKQTEVTASGAAKARTKAKIATSRTKRTSTPGARRTRIAQLPPPPPGTFRAPVLGITPEGNIILGLPSGEIAIVPPEPDRPRRRFFIERRRVFVPPSQPFVPFPPEY